MPFFPNDPYETEYEFIEDVEILREGVWNGYPYDENFIDEISLTYDLNILRAPLTLGHYGDGSREEHGHILALKKVDEKTDLGYVSLMTTIGFLTTGAEKINTGKFNERSIAWWNQYPTPGFPYLLHLALLGDSNPAVIGLKPIKFSPQNKDEDFKDSILEKAELMAMKLSAFENITKDVKYNPENLNWRMDSESGDIIFKVREMSRFTPGSLRIKTISKDEGIRANAGLLKSEYLPEGRNKESLFNESILFNIERGWTLKKAKSWIEEKKTLSLDFEDEFYELIIDETENSWRYRVRPPGNFRQDTFRTVSISKKEGISAVMGKLKPDKVPKDKNPDSMVIQSVIFSKDKDWTKEKVTKWIQEHKDTLDVLQVENDENSIKFLTATAEGGQNMPNDTVTTAKDGGQLGTGTVAEEKKVESSVVTLVEAGSILDRQKTTEQLIGDIESQKSKTQAELDELEKELRKEMFATSFVQVTARCRTLLATGHLIPSQFELHVVELLASIPEECGIEIISKDGVKKKIKTRDGLLEVLKEGGRVKLRGEVTPRIDETEDEGPNADLDKLDRKGISTESERMRRKLTEKYPNKSSTEIMIMLEKELRKGGERR